MAERLLWRHGAELVRDEMGMSIYDPIYLSKAIFARLSGGRRNDDKGPFEQAAFKLIFQKLKLTCNFNMKYVHNRPLPFRRISCWISASTLLTLPTRFLFQEAPV